MQRQREAHGRELFQEELRLPRPGRGRELLSSTSLGLARELSSRCLGTAPTLLADIHGSSAYCTVQYHPALAPCHVSLCPAVAEEYCPGMYAACEIKTVGSCHPCKSLRFGVLYCTTYMPQCDAISVGCILPALVDRGPWTVDRGPWTVKFKLVCTRSRFVSTRPVQ